MYGFGTRKHPSFLYLRNKGVVTRPKELALGPAERTELLVDLVLERRKLVLYQRHIRFLEQATGKSFDYKTTEYWKALRRYLSEEQAEVPVMRFLDLFSSIRKFGFQDSEEKPVGVCDLGNILEKIRYYRYDGTHRACIAKVLGMHEIPVLLTEVRLRA